MSDFRAWAEHQVDTLDRDELVYLLVAMRLELPPTEEFRRRAESMKDVNVDRIGEGDVGMFLDFAAVSRYLADTLPAFDGEVER